MEYLPLISYGIYFSFTKLRQWHKINTLTHFIKKYAQKYKESVDLILGQLN